MLLPYLSESNDRAVRLPFKRCVCSIVFAAVSRVYVRNAVIQPFNLICELRLGKHSVLIRYMLQFIVGGKKARAHTATQFPEFFRRYKPG